MMSVHSQTECVTDQPVTCEIVETVAALKGVATSDLAPLYTVIDPDALEDLFTGPSQNGHVTFRYEGCTVQIDADDQITIDGTTNE